LKTCSTPVTQVNNLLVDLDPDKYTTAERVVLGRIWTDVQRLSASLEVFSVLKRERVSAETCAIFPKP
jgi:hypothetical protein